MRPWGHDKKYPEYSGFCLLLLPVSNPHLGFDLSLRISPSPFLIPFNHQDLVRRPTALTLVEQISHRLIRASVFNATAEQSQRAAIPLNVGWWQILVKGIPT